MPSADVLLQLPGNEPVGVACAGGRGNKICLHIHLLASLVLMANNSSKGINTHEGK